ncbi:hypothetical protein [Bacillus sp. RAR_GA_16]|nr:hypothetical protein [Bacillus sp. RAR_GA_16]MCA0172208.1 hypothetical protein [Bacillus sp. RAR_GA_16]
MEKTSWWKNTLEWFGWSILMILPFWIMIVLSSELSGHHMVHLILSYFK